MSKPIRICLAACCAAALLTGCQVSGSELQPTTEPAVIETGWQQRDGQTVYIDPDGTAATGWQELDGKLYYFHENGARVTGWLSLDGQKYYLDSDGAAVSGLYEIGGTAYLFDSTGCLASGWTDTENGRYYADENGHPATGWIELEDGRYYLDSSGTMVTGWIELEGLTYYLKEDGCAATGQLTIDGTAHFFASDGQELLLVNPWHHMPEDYTVELVDIGSGHRVAAEACEDFQEMLADCKDAGMKPVVRSSYRTQEDQEYLYARRIRRFEKQGYSKEEATELAGTIVAIPGTSEHQLGLALDIVDSRNQNLDESQAEMPTQQWLMENSWRYGWILRYPDDKSEITGIIYEPWHYRYVGRKIAAEIHESGLCLEEYLEALTK